MLPLCGEAEAGLGFSWEPQWPTRSPAWGAGTDFLILAIFLHAPATLLQGFLHLTSGHTAELPFQATGREEAPTSGPHALWS